MKNKEIDKIKLKKIQKLLKTKKYLDKKDLSNICKEFKMCKAVVYRELLKNKIPFQSGSAELTFKSFNIEIINNSVDFEKIKHLEPWSLNLFSGCKTNVFYKCKICNKCSKSRINNLITRKYFSFEPICPKCILKQTTNTVEWKKTNSDAQKIAQNKPERIQQNKECSIKLNQNPDFIKRKSISLKKALNTQEHKEIKRKISLQKWSDPTYAKKVIENSKNNYKTGIYNGLYYQSGYELAFLLKFKDKINDIKRANFYIQYVDKKNIIRHYYPDFIIDKDKLLIEVKGYGPWVDLSLLNLKNKSAKKWCKENGYKFRLITDKDLGVFIKQAKIIHNEIKKQKNN